MVISRVDKSKDDFKAMKTDNNKPLCELQRAQISDLADGQLRGVAFADAMALLEASSSARAAWHGLHLTGDVLRGDATANATNIAKDLAFLDTFKANLAKEPLLKPIAQANELRVAPPTANDAVFNWKWVGGLSAAAAAVFFSWNLVGTTASAPNGTEAQLAQKAVKEAVQLSAVATQTTAGVMLRNPQLDALIAAHNQVGGSSALQMPSGFLRSATFSTDVPATVLSDK
jgi:sigma-E factor negative regulatory protein RseA